jgi:hypothetical protein
MLAAVVVFSLWSLVVKLDFRAPFAAFGGLSSGDLAEVFGRVYGWVALLVCVLALNRWFARAMDRELEEQRG